MTVRQLSAPVRMLAAFFRRKSAASSPKPVRESKPVMRAEKPPLILRVAWTGLWPVRKLTCLVFVGLFLACEAVRDFNDRHNDTPAKILAGLLVGVFVIVVGGLLVLFALYDFLSFAIIFGVIVGSVVVFLGLLWFLTSDFAAAIGDFFVSAYYQVCRQTKFKD